MLRNFQRVLATCITFLFISLAGVAFINRLARMETYYLCSWRRCFVIYLYYFLRFKSVRLRQEHGWHMRRSAGCCSIKVVDKQNFNLLRKSLLITLINEGNVWLEIAGNFFMFGSGNYALEERENISYNCTSIENPSTLIARIWKLTLLSISMNRWLHAMALIMTWIRQDRC